MSSGGLNGYVGRCECVEKKRGIYLRYLWSSWCEYQRVFIIFWLFERETKMVEDEIGQVNVTGRLRRLWITRSEKVVL
jgi:hypothetical protein